MSIVDHLKPQEIMIVATTVLEHYSSTVLTNAMRTASSSPSFPSIVSAFVLAYGGSSTVQ